MKHTKRILALLLMSAVFLISATPASALFGKKEETAAPGAPTAEAMEIETYQGIPYTGEFTAADGEGDTITFAVADEPRKGSVELCEGGFVYTPGEKKSGKDSFTFTATDSAGNTSLPATVSITILKRETTVMYADMTDHSAYNAAICLAEEGIYAGRSVAGQCFFEPEEEVSRSEFLAMAMDAAEIAVSTDVTLTGFVDDEAIPTWAKSYASAAVREGIVSGVATSEGVSFCGDEPISLSEAATVMDRLLDVADVELEELEGVRESWAAQAVANMESVQVVAAGSFGTPAVAETVNRAQAAEMLCAAISLMESEADDGGLFGWFR